MDIYDPPSFLFVQLIPHDLGKLTELSFRLGIVAVYNDILQVPKAPAQILQPLALFKEASNLRAYLRHPISMQ
jgi:hypothetical protein